MSDFLHLGPARSASTWLAHVISCHPEIFIPKSKDTEYFSHQFGRGEDWYRNFFPLSDSKKVSGEICHRYFWHPLAPVRARKFNPDFLILISVRDPWDRLVSAYHYDRTLYLKKEVSLVEYMELPVVKATLDYVSNMKRWLDYFPEKQFHISFYDELKADPKTWLDQVWGHLGVTPYWEKSFEEPIWSSRTCRNETLAHFAFSVSQLLRAHGHYNLVGTVKKKNQLLSLLYQSGSSLSDNSMEDFRIAQQKMEKYCQEWRAFRQEWVKKKKSIVAA